MAAQPEEEVEFLKRAVRTLAHETVDMIDDYGEVHPLGSGMATVGIWIDGHEYSLTLNRED